MKKIIGHDGLYKDELGVVHVKRDTKAEIYNKRKAKMEDFDKRLEKLENLIVKIYEKIDGRSDSNN